MYETTDVGSAFIARRIALGLSQSALGQRVGVSQPQIARWEKTRYRTASVGRLEAVARALGLFLQAVPDAASLQAAETRAAYTAALPDADPSISIALARTGADPEAIAAFCRLRGIDELALFGSVLGDDFGPESDVDVLVTYSAHALLAGFSELDDTERALSGLFRRRVDLVDRRTIERSSNYLRRESILGSARPVYVAR